MLSVRNTILGALGLGLLSVVIAVASLMSDPDSAGDAIDSFGTTQDGFRAIYELLAELHVPVERHIEPPAPTMAETAAYVLWMPHGDLIENEPAYLQRMSQWVEAGGRLVVSLPPSGRGSQSFHERSSREMQYDFWKLIGLKGVRLRSFQFSNSDPNRSTDADLEDKRAMRARQIQRSIELMTGSYRYEFETVPVEAAGFFDNGEHPLRNLQVPQEYPGNLELTDKSSLVGTVDSKKPDGTSWTLAAAFSRGQGTIVVVAEPMLLMNGSLANADNSLFAFDILARNRSRVIFDEFYHGLSVRGNPLWLLTKAHYAAFVIVLLILCGLEIWRRAIVLGPPLESSPPTRRTIVEYIQAMAPVLNKAQGRRLYLLSEVRTGVLRTVGDRLGLAPASHEVESIARLLAKRSESQANEFRDAMTQLDLALENGPRTKEAEAVRVLQRISRCL